MNHWKSFLLLFVIGVLLSFSRMGQTATNNDVVLTKTNHILFSGKVDDESVAKAQIQLAALSLTSSVNDTIYLVIDSPGGSVPAGNRFIDFANSLPQNIKPICLFCASMGYHMFQSFGERLVYSSSELMSHRVQIGGLGGQVPGEAVTRLNDIIAVSKKMDEKVASRIGLSVQDYQKLIYDELWLDGDSAVKLKHADRIAKIRCSDELLKSKRNENYNTIFGPIDVVFSDCPLIAGPLELNYDRKHFKTDEEVKTHLRKSKRNITIEY